MVAGKRLDMDNLEGGLCFAYQAALASESRSPPERAAPSDLIHDTIRLATATFDLQTSRARAVFTRTINPRNKSVAVENFRERPMMFCFALARSDGLRRRFAHRKRTRARR